MAAPKYRQGRIIWAWLRSRSGKKEQHPAAIISANSEIVQPEDFDPRSDLGRVNAVAVIGISTEFRKYPPFVVLPFAVQPRGHSVTGLKAECGACIGWYDWVALEDDVLARAGDVPRVELDQIKAMVSEDLQRKLTKKIGRLGGQIGSLHRLLAELLGEP